jgi:hypothetical protein
MSTNSKIYFKKKIFFIQNLVTGIVLKIISPYCRNTNRLPMKLSKLKRALNLKNSLPFGLTLRN